MKQLYLAVAVTFSCFLSSAQDMPVHRVLVVGNTADLASDASFYNGLSDMMSNSQVPTTLVINGDFSDGSENFYQDSLNLSKQIALVRNQSLVDMLYIPGDRDWSDSGPDGWDYVRKLEKLVDDFNQPNVQWPIEKGCPGPEAIELGPQLLLIALQTQWWNHPYDRPLPADATCKIATPEDFMEELEDIIEDNGDKNILIAGHYPMLSYGPYGGKWPLHKYLFPVPVVSGLQTSYRSNVGTPKDLSNHRFSELQRELEQLFMEQHQLIYIASHERNLQILHHQDHYLVNSGAPINPGFPGKGRKAMYSASHEGLVELQYFQDGQVTSIVHKFSENQFTPVYNFPLYNSFCSPENDNTPANSRVVPCKELENTSGGPGTDADSVKVLAGAEYKASWVKESWLGKHYRDSWTTPIMVPLLNIDTTFNGLVPYQKGGGRQTTSLKFRAADGNEFVFRSVNKDPTKALDYEYRNTIVGRLVRDQTSAQQPYGAMVADNLLNHLDILHAHPKLYVLPNEPKLRQFQEQYAGLLGMLEENPTNPDSTDQRLGGADEIFKSFKMFRELYEDNNNRLNTEDFVRARVFDLLVGDWGKHEDNWKWAGYRQAKGMRFRPIPRDRDHVFSLWDGILPWLADREWAKPSAANFGHEFKGIKSLMWQARHLDRFLASELNRQQWINAAQFIQQNISNGDITAAVKSMPPEIYQDDGNIIEEKLKQRLSNLHQAASDYYDLLAKEVDVVGSNNREYFSVHRTPQGPVEVSVSKLDSRGQGPDSSSIFYYRKFLPGETKEIRLFGLQKADHFHLTGEARKSIPIRIIGGPGADHVIDESEVGGPGKKTMVYEKSSNGVLNLGTEAKLVKHWNDEVYNYDRTAFAYNQYLPLLFISSSKDFGLGIRGGVQFTGHRFGKQDYSSKHSVQLAVSSEDIKVIDYEAQFHHVLGKWDILLAGLAADHYYFTYFFGIGNDTEKIESLFDQDYYRTSYNTYQFTAGVKREFWEDNQSNFSFRLHYENNQEQIDDNTIIKDPEFPQEITGAEDTNLFEAILNLDLDLRDRVSLPEKGMRLNIQHQSGITTSNDNEHYGVTQGFLENFITAYLKRPVTFVLRLGGSKGYGDIPFYKLKYLGQRNDLRGYLRNRFTGTSSLFINTELRWELSEFHTTIFPVRFGLRGFFDTGRVYSEYDISNQWHKGYGGGFYFVPLKEEFSLNLSFAFSQEEKGLFLLGIGKAF